MLYELAGKDPRFCLDAWPDGRASRANWTSLTAGQLLLAPSISSAAWQDALAAKSDFRIALCVLVTDANHDHPATRIRKPGGHLRALTPRH